MDRYTHTFFIIKKNHLLHVPSRFNKNSVITQYLYMNASTVMRLNNYNLECKVVSGS